MVSGSKTEEEGVILDRRVKTWPTLSFILMKYEYDQYDHLSFNMKLLIVL